MSTFRTLSKLLGKKITGSKILVRVDLNLPLDARGQVGYAESFRLEAILPTLNALLKQKATLIILSHRGRPMGQVKPELSLKPFANLLGKALNQEINFIADPFTPESRVEISEAKAGTIFLLENLRFFPGEDDNDSRFARELAKMGDYYVNDAFAVSHRSAASIVNLAKILPCYAGLSLESEVKHLRQVLAKPKRPLLAILAGAKISTKLKIIRRLSRVANSIFLAGGLANTCIKAAGHQIGQSLVENSALQTAKSLNQNKKIILPIDFRVVKSKQGKLLAGSAEDRIPNDIRRDEWIGDIGPESERILHTEISNAGSIIWNGPLGFFEDYRFRQGTNAVVNALLDFKGEFIIGGGETVQAWRQGSEKRKVSPKAFISTGGGAMIEFLEGKKLPGIRVLETN